MDYKEKYEELVEAARAVVEGNPGLCDMNKRLGRVRDLLPEKESEDERIRKEIIEFLTDGIWRAKEISKVRETQKYAKWISYLEKQKEQKPIRSVAQLPGNNDVFDANLNEIKNIDEAAGYYMQGEIDTDSDCLDEDGQPLYYADALRKAFLFGAKWQKEQNVPGYKTDDYFCEKCQENAFNAGKEAGLKEQKPEEWSEEDERNINTLISVIEEHYTDYDIVRDDYPINAIGLCNWLKSLRPQTHWKPSAEQIQALTVAIDEAARCEEPYWRDSLHDVLLSLHTDLKKLF